MLSIVFSCELCSVLGQDEVTTSAVLHNMESPVPFTESSCSSEFVLESPKNRKEFESKAGQAWARKIVIDYWTRTDEGWLLAPMLKILSVMAKENPTPGGLSRSYCLEVFYKIGDQMTQQHWFVKIPKTLQTVAMDERELVMYNTIFPRLKVDTHSSLNQLKNILVEFLERPSAAK